MTSFRHITITIRPTDSPTPLGLPLHSSKIQISETSKTIHEDFIQTKYHIIDINYIVVNTKYSGFDDDDDHGDHNHLDDDYDDDDGHDHTWNKVK